MKKSNPLIEIIHANKMGSANGIYSICSSNQFVIESALMGAKQSGENEYVLIESTSNQVNQFGGYMGLTPSQFAAYVNKIAVQIGFLGKKIVLGGDHLGPNVWRGDPSEIAMEKSCELVSSSVKAGYTKIHLDASMKCADDPTEGPLDTVVSAKRAARLCKAAEDTYKSNLTAEWAPCYVIGTEVPVPGGAAAGEHGLTITSPADAQKTIDITHDAFLELGLSAAWERVIGLVVQPGVEFSHAQIHEYDPALAKPLSKFIEQIPGMVFEAHSTDYQLPELLKKMVRDHFAILKVGPALTFAFREAVFALAEVENQWLMGEPTEPLSNLVDVADQVMVENPEYWSGYYQGNETEKAFARKYSLSDRIRYYWSDQKVNQALRILIRNLTNNPAPLMLISQFLPRQYEHIREGKIQNNPHEMILDSIQEILKVYQYTCSCK